MDKRPSLTDEVEDAYSMLGKEPRRARSRSRNSEGTHEPTTPAQAEAASGERADDASPADDDIISTVTIELLRSGEFRIRRSRAPGL